MKTKDGVEHTNGMTLYIIEHGQLLTRYNTRLNWGKVYTSFFRDHLYGKLPPSEFYGQYTEALKELIRVTEEAHAEKISALRSEYERLIGIR